MNKTQVTKKIGIIGCGTIGGFIAGKLEELPELQLCALADLNSDNSAKLAEQLACSVTILPVAELVSQVNLVVEAAGKSIVPSLIDSIIEHKKDALFMSLGGFIELTDLQWRKLMEYRGEIYLPSGAIAGLDAIKAAKCGRLDEVIITSCKPPAGLIGAPYLIENGIDISDIKHSTLVFEGNAREAIAGFPKNVNVAVALSLAGLGPDKTKVRIMADPNTKTNSHQIEAYGDFGEIITQTNNLPSPSNPKTSYLASLSAIATLKRITSCIKLGS